MAQPTDRTIFVMDTKLNRHKSAIQHDLVPMADKNFEIFA